MAGYIRYLYGGGMTPYALIKHPTTNQVANLVSQQWATYSSPSRSNYKFTMVREASTDSWYATIPDWLSDSVRDFDVEIYLRAGVNVADADDGVANWRQNSASLVDQIVDAVLDELVAGHNGAGTVGAYLQTSASGNLTQGDVDAVTEAILSADLAVLIDQSLEVPKHSLASLILQHQAFCIDGELLTIFDPNTDSALQTYSITFGSTCPIKALE